MVLAALLGGCTSPVVVTQEVDLPATPTIIKTTRGILAPSSTVPLTETPAQAEGTPTPVLTHTASNVQEFTVTQTPTEPTPLAKPTYVPEETERIVIDFLRTNNGCKLPCLWGIEPSRTEVKAFKEFVQRFGSLDIDGKVIVESRFYEDVGGTDFMFWNGPKVKWIGISYWSSGEKINILRLLLKINLDRGEGEYREFLPLYGDPILKDFAGDFVISRILSIYGKPAEVYISPFPKRYSHSEDDYPPLFSVVLFYPEQGFFMQYIQPRRENGGYYYTCLSEVGDISFVTWEPHKDLQLKDVAQYSSGEGLNELNVSEFKTIHDAARLTVEGFYQKFMRTDGNQCIETRKASWPEIPLYEEGAFGEGRSIALWTFDRAGVQPAW